VPRFELPNREYYLLAGPVAAAAQIQSPAGHGLQPPDLWWPEDRAWFFATDTDLAWTYVGGTQALVDEVVVAVRRRTTPVDRSLWNAEAGDPSDRCDDDRAE
jgi:hypothetical protein